MFRMWTFPEFRKQLLASGFTSIRLFGRLEAGAEEATTQAPRLVIVAERASLILSCTSFLAECVDETPGGGPMNLCVANYLLRNCLKLLATM